MKEFENCMLCPRNCGVNRMAGETGFCNTDANLHISTICIHHGEEPAISGMNGICNVFLSSCNMQCIYCQNFQISRNNPDSYAPPYTLEQAVNEIITCLEKDVHAVGFVTPTHQSPYVKAIIKTLHQRNYFPTIVYNTNGFEKTEILASMEGLVDVYLPDFKYLNPTLAKAYSDAVYYPEAIIHAMKEMHRQKGNNLILDYAGQALSGLIIRHLVLPGSVGDSKNILDWIATHLSSSVSISLMSQYYPTSCVSDHQLLGRSLYPDEYHEVVTYMENLGFINGWIQEMESNQHYRPDFNQGHPFVP